MHVLILLVVSLIVLPAVLLLWRRQRPAHLREELSPITRQHIDLFQGGQLSEGAVESFKIRFRELLERGERDAVEASMRAGMQFVVQVRALAELGTEDAGLILERQLHRKLTDDQIEQAWYWIDLAHGLRSLNRFQSLPHLLRCFGEWDAGPLGQFFAAETVCFLGFAGYLRQPTTPLGRSAMRVLHRALEGLRFGVQPVVVVEGRLGELVESVWDHRPEGTTDPLAGRIFLEALRLRRRAGHGELLLTEETSELEAFRWQMSRIAALEPALGDYLDGCSQHLPRLLKELPATEHRDVLLTLIDLRLEAGELVLPLVKSQDYPYKELALELLTHSRAASVENTLREWILESVPLVRRAQRRSRTWPPRRSSLPEELPYQGILRALRGHPSPRTEALLLLAARDYDPTFRAAAVSSLGWWEPLERYDVLLTLQDTRRDSNPDVRQAARAALARLGERQALQWFRQSLTSEDPHHVHDAIQTIANEGLTLLYPELDRLADADDTDVAHHAREALERMSEDMERRRDLI